jgi:CRISPR/Cas system-associated protein Cas7 (RAMP superfamily)
MPETRALSYMQIVDSYTSVRRENVLILSTDKNMKVRRYQPITKNDVPYWVTQLLDGIHGELEGMDALMQETREKNFEIQMALQELAEAYNGPNDRQNEIYDAVCLEVEKME